MIAFANAVEGERALTVSAYADAYTRSTAAAEGAACTATVWRAAPASLRIWTGWQRGLRLRRRRGAVLISTI
ncbi:MAG: hypothetical protein U1F21_09690 [Sphaerotilus natans]